MGLTEPSSAPACGHDASRGFVEYTVPAARWWARLFRLRPERYVYCRRCHTRLRAIFDGYWAGRTSLAEVEAELRAMAIHDSEREIRRVIRTLRRTPNALAA